MDELEDSEGIEKKQRKRQKRLMKQICSQMEFYFSDSNLNKDRYLNQLICQSEDKYVELDVFMKFNKIRKMTENVETLGQALLNSKLLQLNDDHSQVRRITPVEKLKDVDDCTLYVENFSPNIDHDWLKKIFSAFGVVNYISLPRFKSTNTLKGFAFVEFQSATEARNAIKALRKDYFDNESSCENYRKDSLKRKRQSSDDEVDKKRLKIDNILDIFKDNEKKKANKHRKRKKKNKEKVEEFHNLKVLSKKEWIILKKEYIQLQKSNMASLKNMLLMQKESENEKEEKVSQHIQFTPGVIIRMTTTDEITSFLEFKRSFQNVCDVLYVDLKEGQKQGYIRCKTSDGAQKLLASSLQLKSVKLELVTGSEEQDYWEKIWRDRKIKISTKEQVRKRGKTKILERVDKIVKKAKHIYFDE